MALTAHKKKKTKTNRSYDLCHCTLVLAEVNIITEVNIIGAKESVYKTKKLSCFFVLEHQCGRLYVVHVKNLFK